MGADAEWSPPESHSAGAPMVPPLITDPATPYRDAVLRSPLFMTEARIPDWPVKTGPPESLGYPGPDRLTAGFYHPCLWMVRSLGTYKVGTGEILDRVE